MRRSRASRLPLARSFSGDLLSSGDPLPWQLHGAGRAAPFLLICDHGGHQVPCRLIGLGLRTAELERHIGWDAGVAEVGRHLAERLSSPLVLQPYSRLVIDCNRQPGSPDSIPEVSDGTVIPGNRRLRRSEVSARIDEIFRPYHDRIRSELDERERSGLSTILVSLHSFTPELHGIRRPWHIGLLSNRDARVARALEQDLLQEPGIVVGRNEPYSMADGVDYSVPEHGERRGLPHVLIELRQDLIADSSGQQRWAHRLARLLLPLDGRFQPLPAPSLTGS